MEQPRKPKFHPNQTNISIAVDITQLDEALEKANQLAEKLKEVEHIANSLLGKG